MEVLVCAVTFLAYVSTLSFGFIYDDKPVIVDNVIIRSWHFLGQYFIPQLSSGIAPLSETFYRPVTLLWLRLNYALFGLNPAGWHFAMLLGHVLATYLVFVLVERLSDSRRIAFVAALLFGLHPVHVENVAWLTSVNDLLMTVFLLGSLLAYLNSRGGQKLWMALSVLLFFLALLSKETAAVFPFLILGFAVIFARRPNAAGNSTRVWSSLQSGFVSIPYFMILVIYLAARRIMLHALAQPITPIPWSTMLLTTPSVLWFDLKHLLFPTSSSEFYSLTYVTTPGFESFLLPTLLLLVALVATAYFISRLPDPRLGVFALLFAIATILPTLYLRAIASGNFVHDRFLYLPSVGVVILIAVALERIVGWKSRVVVGWAVVTVFSCAAFAGTLSYQMQWASNILLYQNALKYAPDNPIVQVNLANEFANLGHYDRAFPLYLNALKSDPRSWLSNYNLGYAYYRTGRATEAEEYLKRAIQIDDKDPDQFIYLALAQMQHGELTAAAQNAERAIEKAPMSGGFHLVLAKILEAGGNRERAIAEYKAELSAHPENGLARSELQRLQSSN